MTEPVQLYVVLHEPAETSSVQYEYTYLAPAVLDCAVAVLTVPVVDVTVKVLAEFNPSAEIISVPFCAAVIPFDIDVEFIFVTVPAATGVELVLPVISYKNGCPYPPVPDFVAETLTVDPVPLT